MHPISSHRWTSFSWSYAIACTLSLQCLSLEYGFESLWGHWQSFHQAPSACMSHGAYMHQELLRIPICPYCHFEVISSAEKSKLEVHGLFGFLEGILHGILLEKMAHTGILSSDAMHCIHLSCSGTDFTEDMAPRISPSLGPRKSCLLELLRGWRKNPWHHGMQRWC